jgi:hypothetical protein
MLLKESRNGRWRKGAGSRRKVVVVVEEEEEVGGVKMFHGPESGPGGGLLAFGLCTLIFRRTDGLGVQWPRRGAALCQSLP